MENKYQRKNNYYKLIINSPKYGFKEYLISECDLKRCQRRHWAVHRVQRENFGEYFYCESSDYEKKTMLHRYIMSAQKGEVVDHINGNVLDNRRTNLRICDCSDNAKNRKLQQNNKSGHRGVIWNKKAGKWMAYIACDKKDKTLGYFNDFNKACVCREMAESFYFGEFKSNRVL